MRSPETVLGSDIETEILAALEDAGTEVSLPSLLQRLKHKGVVADSEIKAAIWELLNRQLIDMTSERNLTIHR